MALNFRYSIIIISFIAFTLSCTAQKELSYKDQVNGIQFTYPEHAKITQSGKLIRLDLSGNQKLEAYFMHISMENLSIAQREVISCCDTFPIYGGVSGNYQSPKTIEAGSLEFMGQIFFEPFYNGNMAAHILYQNCMEKENKCLSVYSMISDTNLVSIQNEINLIEELVKSIEYISD